MTATSLVSAASASTTASGLLRHLAADDHARISPHLEALTVERGMLLVDDREVGGYLYFPQGPLISIAQRNGVEVALIGSEGLVGWPAFAGASYSPFRALVRGRDGLIFRMRIDVAAALLLRAPAVAQLFHRFTTTIGVQMAETIGACASHRIETRLARWILLRHDRVAGDEILVQHDEIAENLGSRRASVTDWLHVIEGERLVRCRRGRILVRNREALETLANGCYGTAEALYRQSIGRFGKSAPAIALLANVS